MPQHSVYTCLRQMLPYSDSVLQDLHNFYKLLLQIYRRVEIRQTEEKLMHHHTSTATQEIPAIVPHNMCVSTCPSCGKKTIFEYAGKQTWPEAVARITGFSETHLWHCSRCRSTVNEQDLR